MVTAAKAAGYTNTYYIDILCSSRPWGEGALSRGRTVFLTSFGWDILGHELAHCAELGLPHAGFWETGGRGPISSGIGVDESDVRHYGIAQRVLPDQRHAQMEVVVPRLGPAMAWPVFSPGSSHFETPPSGPA